MTNEINDVKPNSIKNLIGQRGVLDQVGVALDAAFADNKKFDHSLLVGPPGLGKSQTAFVISQEMGTGFHEVLGQSIVCPADLNALLLGANERDVIHIDECHELPKEYQTTLYLALDQRKITLGGGRSGKSVQSVPLADFTLLLSTTDGVDTLLDQEGKALIPGTPDFVEVWDYLLNSNEQVTFEAYFPEYQEE